MLTIKKETKKGIQWIIKAKSNEGEYLWQVYDSFSNEKAKAYEECRKMCARENGTNFRIISHCQNFFTVAWNTEKALRIETYANSYEII